MEQDRIFTPGREHPEEDYELLARLGAKLGLPVPQMHITLEVSLDGKSISVHRQRSRTWNRNFWNAVICIVSGTPGVVTNFGAGYLSFKNTSAAVSALSAAQLSFAPAGAINNSLYGIQVGTGTAAESFEGYVINTLIAHGNGAGQLAYSAHSALVQGYVAGTKTWTVTIKRIFNNNSGGAIVVAETTLVYNNVQISANYMLNRDLLASTQNVPNGAQCTVSYDVSLTFPA